MNIVVIKCGGSVLDELTEGFFTSIGELQESGVYPVIVHGGGPAINTVLEVYNIPAKFENGLRVTCEKTMEIVEMVLSGQTNRQLCEMLNKHGFNAIGLNGSDGACLQADYINKSLLGHVGEITAVNPELIMMAIRNNFLPVITPIAVSKDGKKLNVNGDYAAAAIAEALHAAHCAFVTNVDGILIDGKLIREVTDKEIDRYISDGSIYGGMVPKVKSALGAMSAGVEKVMIISGKNQFFKNNSWQGTAIGVKERMLK
ncbi:MAG TPA: acetylglutamate kinase [Bacillus bacterium]|nr:acetylglutamate kinase [Bacillus sp. (in: firmicutes)]